MTLDFQIFDSLTVPAGSSAAAEIAAALPHSAVLEAFNTNFAAILAAGTTGEAPAAVLIADGNTQAKALLADVVTAAGLRAIADHAPRSADGISHHAAAGDREEGRAWAFATWPRSALTRRISTRHGVTARPPTDRHVGYHGR